ncbi:MAG: hypothetical protein ABI867_45580, partial [Kofleriaceae bacterium]
MRVAMLICVLVTSVGIARAQAPGDSPPVPVEPGPPPPPPPAVPPQAVAPTQRFIPVQLTSEEAQLLQTGEITLGAHAGGVALNWLVGFGLGQAVQGRWSETGWIFTLGEAVTFGALVYGLSQTCLIFCTEAEEQKNHDAAPFLIGGFVGYLVFHVWGIADAAIGPAKHNRKVRELRMRLG